MILSNSLRNRRLTSSPRILASSAFTGRHVHYTRHVELRWDDRETRWRLDAPETWFGKDGVWISELAPIWACCMPTAVFVCAFMWGGRLQSYSVVGRTCPITWKENALISRWLASSLEKNNRGIRRFISFTWWVMIIKKVVRKDNEKTIIFVSHY